MKGCSGEIGAGQVRATEAGIGKISGRQFGATQVCAGEIIVVEVGSRQVGALQVGVPQRCVTEVGPFEVCIGQIVASHVDAGKIGLRKVGLLSHGTMPFPLRREFPAGGDAGCGGEPRETIAQARLIDG